jgi:hypothetical protein
MKTSGRVALGAIVTVAVIGWLLQLSPLAQSGSWTHPKTPWGDPDLQGIYTNKDEANTPLERPDEFKGRDAETFSAADLARLAKERQALAAKIAGGIGGAETGAGPTHWYEHLQGGASRPWLIVDPADGKLPAMTPLGLKREAAWAALHNARNGEGRADSWLDRSLYDRCITRGLPGSMMPAIYGNSYEITQSPGVVAIRYEMIHEARIIPLEPSALREPQGRPEQGRGTTALSRGDGRARLSPAIRMYMGDARGRWEGNTLVVETTNFTDRTHMGYNFRYNSEKYTLTERFTPVSATRLQWQVTVADPDTWTRPWTYTMPLTRDDGQPVFEYACHEGNRGLEHIFKAARAEERGK